MFARIRAAFASVKNKYVQIKSNIINFLRDTVSPIVIAVIKWNLIILFCLLFLFSLTFVLTTSISYYLVPQKLTTLNFPLNFDYHHEKNNAEKFNKNSENSLQIKNEINIHFHGEQDNFVELYNFLEYKNHKPYVKLQIPDGLIQNSLQYSFYLKFKLPITPVNAKIGNLMIYMNLLDKYEQSILDTTTTIYVPSRSYLSQIIRSILYAVPEFLGLCEPVDYQTIYLPIILYFYQVSSETPTKYIEIELSHPALQIYQANLLIEPELQGFPYFMQNYFPLFFLFVFFVIFCISSFALLLSVAFYVYWNFQNAENQPLPLPLSLPLSESMNQHFQPPAFENIKKNKNNSSPASVSGNKKGKGKRESLDLDAEASLPPGIPIPPLKVETEPASDEIVELQDGQHVISPLGDLIITEITKIPQNKILQDPNDSLPAPSPPLPSPLSLNQKKFQ